VIYRLLLAGHSLNRWLVVVLLMSATVLGARGWIAARPWSRGDDRTGRLLTAVMDLQLLLGLLLYVGFSPYTRAGWADLAGAMTDRVLRFWTVEHAPTMLLAVALVHAGRVLVRRAEAPRARHRCAAVTFGLATLLVLAAIPWPFLAYGRALLPWG
jgi:hypothetical protein